MVLLLLLKCTLLASLSWNGLTSLVLLRNRVVAVFALGPAWQFKDWKWSSPVELFSKSTYRQLYQTLYTGLD